MDKFFTEVIADKYDYKVTNREDSHPTFIDDLTIDKIELGDTRHFAFCSLILQGLNPLTIARIGGHSDLSTQMGYYSHLDNFVESNVYVLSEAIKSQQEMVVNSVFDTNEIVVRSKIKGSTNTEALRDIEDGKCFSKNFPGDCMVTDCLFCNYFILDLSKDIASRERLKDMSTKLQAEIRTQIDLLKSISLNMAIDKGTLACDENQSSELKSTSNKLSRLVSQKATVDAYLQRRENI